MSEDLAKAKAEAEQSPLVWMIELERAREGGDFERAAAAQRQLARLGVRVTYQGGERRARKAVRDDK